MNTLTQLELLYRDKTTGMYHLGSKLIQYGMAAIGNEDITSRITPYLQEISHNTSCTVLFPFGHTMDQSRQKYGIPTKT